jgi:GDP-4-dehydro-6-deoxy-D-mannose reductase
VGPVLVTGAAGFAGGHLLEHLARERPDVELVAWARRLPPDVSTRPGRWDRIDLTHKDAVRDAIARLRPSAVYHCAGYPHASGGWRDSARPLLVNVMITEYLLDALRRAGGGCRVLLPGSGTVYAAAGHALAEDDPVRPRSAYAMSKLAQEQLALRAVQEDGLDVIVTRPFNHTGPRQTPAFAAPSFARQIASIERGEMEPIIRVGNLTARRDLLDVRDVVTAYAALMAKGATGTIYNVASGIARPIAAVLERLIARARVAVTVAPDPERMRPDDTPIMIGDATRLREATGWAPVITFEQTLDDLLDYWRDSPRLPG